MADEKVYTPHVIADIPFPQENQGSIPSVNQGSADIYTQKEIKDQSFPVKRVAQELLSTALNTRSKKILQEFEFTSSGAIQIGKYQEGLSGDVRISPNGMTARDASGNTTFAIDGDTGDAVFKGTVRAGSLIAGDADVVIEESSSGGGRIVIYNGNLPQVVIGDPT